MPTGVMTLIALLTSPPRLVPAVSGYDSLGCWSHLWFSSLASASYVEQNI